MFISVAKSLFKLPLIAILLVTNSLSLVAAFNLIDYGLRTTTS